MEVFEKAFNRIRQRNSKRRTFANLFGGLKTGYLIPYEKAIKDYQSKNLESALQNINVVIGKSDINDWKHYAFRANIFEDLGKYSDAIADYEKAIEFAENDIYVYGLYHQIGFCYLNIGNNLKAVEFYSYAIYLKKEHPNLEHNTDQEGMDMGVLLGVPFKRLYNNRANAYLNIGKLNEAIDDCNKSLEHDINYSNPYLLLSQIFSKAGQESKAIDFLKKSAQLGNKNAILTLRQIGH